MARELIVGRRVGKGRSCATGTHLRRYRPVIRLQLDNLFVRRFVHETLRNGLRRGETQQDERERARRVCRGQRASRETVRGIGDGRRMSHNPEIAADLASLNTPRDSVRRRRGKRP